MEERHGSAGIEASLWGAGGGLSCSTLLCSALAAHLCCRQHGIAAQPLLLSILHTTCSAAGSQCGSHWCGASQGTRCHLMTNCIHLTGSNARTCAWFLSPLLSPLPPPSAGGRARELAPPTAARPGWLLLLSPPLAAAESGGVREEAGGAASRLSPSAVCTAGQHQHCADGMQAAPLLQHDAAERHAACGRH